MELLSPTAEESYMEPTPVNYRSEKGLGRGESSGETYPPDDSSSMAWPFQEPAGIPAKGPASHKDAISSTDESMIHPALRDSQRREGGRSRPRNHPLLAKTPSLRSSQAVRAPNNRYHDESVTGGHQSGSCDLRRRPTWKDADRLKKGEAHKSRDILEVGRNDQDPKQRWPGALTHPSASPKTSTRWRSSSAEDVMAVGSERGRSPILTNREAAIKLRRKARTDPGDGTSRTNSDEMAPTATRLRRTSSRTPPATPINPWEGSSSSHGSRVTGPKSVGGSSVRAIAAMFDSAARESQPAVSGIPQVRFQGDHNSHAVLSQYASNPSPPKTSRIITRSNSVASNDALPPNDDTVRREAGGNRRCLGTMANDRSVQSSPPEFDRTAKLNRSGRIHHGTPIRAVAHTISLDSSPTLGDKQGLLDDRLSSSDGGPRHGPGEAPDRSQRQGSTGPGSQLGRPSVLPPSLGRMVPYAEPPPVAHRVNFARHLSSPHNSPSIPPATVDLDRTASSPASAVGSGVAGPTSQLHAQIRALQRQLDARTEECAQLRAQMDALEKGAGPEIGTLSEQLRRAQRECAICCERAEAAERRVAVFERFSAKIRDMKDDSSSNWDTVVTVMRGRNSQHRKGASSASVHTEDSEAFADRLRNQLKAVVDGAWSESSSRGEEREEEDGGVSEGRVTDQHQRQEGGEYEEVTSNEGGSSGTVVHESNVRDSTMTSVWTAAELSHERAPGVGEFGGWIV